MTNILIYRFSTRYIKHVTLRHQLRNSLGSVFWPQNHILFSRLWTNCSLWTCSNSLMPYRIQFINNCKFILWPLPGPAFLLFFLSPTGWHHRLNGHEFGWTPGVSDGQGGLACCSPWGHRVGHDWATELNWTWEKALQSVFYFSVLFAHCSGKTVLHLSNIPSLCLLPSW